MVKNVPRDAARGNSNREHTPQPASKLAGTKAAASCRTPKLGTLEQNVAGQRCIYAYTITGTYGFKSFGNMFGHDDVWQCAWRAERSGMR
jgi:hypothetical protein